MHTVSRSPYELATHPRLLDIVEGILGPDLLYNVTYIIKEPHSRAFVSWHQDLTYWGFDGSDQVSAWLALSPANAQSGCMQMIPGSHREGMRDQEIADDPDNVLLRSQTVTNVNNSLAVTCELEPREVSLHHGWTVHCSRPNLSGDRRIGLNAQYIRPSMRQTKSDHDSAMLVGEPMSLDITDKIWRLNHGWKKMLLNSWPSPVRNIRRSQGARTLPERLALDQTDRHLKHVNCQPTAGGLFVLVLHVATGIAHRLDHLIQRNKVLTRPSQCHARSTDRLDRTHRIALDTGHLHKAPNGVTGQTKVVLHGNLSCILNLFWAFHRVRRRAPAAIEQAEPTSP